MGGRDDLVTVTSANLKHRLNKFQQSSQNLAQIMTSQGTDVSRKKKSETVGVAGRKSYSSYANF